MIGTLGEKTLHAALKMHFEPDISNHEVKVGSYVADIMTDKGIIEIQTRALDKLRSKLTVFLEEHPTTVVYPIPAKKWLIWIDALTDTETKKRKSPKQGTIYDAIMELYKIRLLMNHPNFILCLVMIDIEEYRYLNGWSDDKKRGSTRCDRVPIDIVETVYFRKPVDYLKFIPSGLPDKFTSKDLQIAANINSRTSQTVLNILNYIGIVERVGKQSRSYVYQRSFGC